MKTVKSHLATKYQLSPIPHLYDSWSLFMDFLNSSILSMVSLRTIRSPGVSKVNIDKTSIGQGEPFMFHFVNSCLQKDFLSSYSRGFISSKSRRTFEGKQAGTRNGKDQRSELLVKSGGILPWKILKTQTPRNTFSCILERKLSFFHHSSLPSLQQNNFLCSPTIF